MSEDNGKAYTGPIFALYIGGGFMVAPRSAIIEKLRAMRASLDATDLHSGPILDEFVDWFRDWSDRAEPGNFADAREFTGGCAVMRIACRAPIEHFVSSGMAKNLAAMQERMEKLGVPPVEEPPGESRIIAE